MHFLGGMYNGVADVTPVDLGTNNTHLPWKRMNYQLEQQQQNSSLAFLSR